jgi:hypothetical protein
MFMQQLTMFGVPLTRKEAALIYGGLTEGSGSSSGTADAYFSYCKSTCGGKKIIIWDNCPGTCVADDKGVTCHYDVMTDNRWFHTKEC